MNTTAFIAGVIAGVIAMLAVLYAPSGIRYLREWWKWKREAWHFQRRSDRWHVRRGLYRYHVRRFIHHRGHRVVMRLASEGKVLKFKSRNDARIVADLLNFARMEPT